MLKALPALCGQGFFVPALLTQRRTGRRCEALQGPAFGRSQGLTCLQHALSLRSPESRALQGLSLTLRTTCARDQLAGCYLLGKPRRGALSARPLRAQARTSSGRARRFGLRPARSCAAGPPALRFRPARLRAAGPPALRFRASHEWSGFLFDPGFRLMDCPRDRGSLSRRRVLVDLPCRVIWRSPPFGRLLLCGRLS